MHGALSGWLIDRWSVLDFAYRSTKNHEEPEGSRYDVEGAQQGISK